MNKDARTAGKQQGSSYNKKKKWEKRPFILKKIALQFVNKFAFDNTIEYHLNEFREFDRPASGENPQTTILSHKE